MRRLLIVGPAFEGQWFNKDLLLINSMLHHYKSTFPCQLDCCVCVKGTGGLYASVCVCVCVSVWCVCV